MSNLDIAMTVLSLDHRRTSCSSSQSDDQSSQTTSDSSSRSVSFSSTVSTSSCAETCDTPGRVAEHLLHTLPQESPISQLHRIVAGTGLLSNLKFAEPTTTQVGSTKCFQQTVAITHYQHGVIEEYALATDKKLVKTAAASRLLWSILEAEKDINQPLVHLPPPTLVLSDKIRTIREKAAKHLQILEGLAKSTYTSTQVVSIDVEMHESDTKSIMLEVGITLGQLSAMRLPEGEQEIESRHFIIEEHISKRNGYLKDRNGTVRCPDRKFEFRADLGHSEIVPLASVKDVISALVSTKTRGSNKTILVGHSNEGDIRWLKDVAGLELDHIMLLDVAEAYKAMEGRDEKRSLEGLLSHYGLSTEGLHNGGNDAFMTYQLARQMLRQMAGHDLPCCVL